MEKLSEWEDDKIVEWSGVSGAAFLTNTDRTPG
jgi:hypothetical protein